MANEGFHPDTETLRRLADLLRKLGKSGVIQPETQEDRERKLLGALMRQGTHMTGLPGNEEVMLEPDPGSRKYPVDLGGQNTYFADDFRRKGEFSPDDPRQPAGAGDDYYRPERDILGTARPGIAEEVLVKQGVYDKLKDPERQKMMVLMEAMKSGKAQRF